MVDAQTGEVLIGAGVSVKEQQRGVLTNAFGFFAIDIEIPCTLTATYLGYEPQAVLVTQQTPLPLKINLKESRQQLKEVVVTAQSKEREVEIQTAGFTRMDMKQISSVPVLGGEKDVVKVLQLMPGVKREHDGSTGMLVRGGSGDQNMVLLDDAPVYNASHLLGFFSVFNSDAIKDVTMQKGGFSAPYGGRLSSVMDVRMKDGNMKRTALSGGVGLLSARGSIEGPILKDKLSYIVSARRTYIDQVYDLIGSSMPFYFYDVNAKMLLKASERNQYMLSAYRGKDILRFGGEQRSPVYNADFANTLRNTTTTFRWNHVYPGRKLFQKTSLIYTQFYYQLHNRIQGNEMKITSSIDDVIGKVGYDYYVNSSNHVQFGAEYTSHRFRPNKATVKGNFNESIKPTAGLDLTTHEMAAYVSNRQRITSRLNADYGLRWSGAVSEASFYQLAEPRLGMSYQLTTTQTLRMGISRMGQYVHLVTGSSALPSDVWFPVTDKIKPQVSDQVTLGYVKQLEKYQSVFTVETYVKQQQRVTEFREGTIAFSNDNIESDIVQGKALAYGIELMLHKQRGRWNGWIGYTLAYTKRKFDELNGGKVFYARYDRRHDVSIVSNYELTKRITLSAVYTFSSGSRFTPMIGQYLVPNGNLNNVVSLPVYSKRNEVVLAPSHRLDVNMVIKSKTRERYSAEWHIGAYNVYNQTQPFRIRIDERPDGSRVYRQVGLFGFIPAIAYNFQF